MKSKLLAAGAIGCAVWLALSTTPAHIVRAELQPVTARSEHARAIKSNQTHGKASNLKLNEFLDYLTADFKNAAERAIDGRGSYEDAGSQAGDSGGAILTAEPIPETAAPAVDEPEQEPVEDSGTAEADSWTDSLTYAGEWTITFYCDCPECCGQWSGMNSTASGQPPIPWYTVAAGYSYPFGTILYIDGFGYFEVMDRGVSDGWADIFVNNHGEIPSYGMTTTSVYIVG